MALSVASGTFNTRTSVGTTNVVVGFQPSIIFIWTTSGEISGTFGDNVYMNLGVATSTAAADQFYYSWFQNDNNAVVVGAFDTQFGTGKIIYEFPNGGTYYLLSASVSAIDATSFTLNYTDVYPTAFIANYLALGGTSVRDAKVGYFNNSTGAAGTQDITGIGFQPNLVLISRGGSPIGPPSAMTDRSRIHLGVASTAGTQWSLCGETRPTGVGTPTQADARYDTGVVIKDLIDSVEADLDAFLPDGFRLDWAVKPALTEYLYYIALDVEEVWTGTYQKSVGAAPASQAITGLGFEPGALIQLSTSTTTAGSSTVGYHIAFGMAGDADMGAMGHQSADNVDPTNCSTVIYTDKSMIKVNNDSKSLEAAATLDSWDADGFTQIWDPNDANASYIGYIAIGATGGGGGGSGGGVGSGTRIQQPSTIPFMGGRRF